MTALEIQSIKNELVQSIVNIDSEEALKEISRVVKRLSTKLPCMYTPDEIWRDVDKVIKAHREGDKSQFIPFEEVKRKYV